MEGRARVAGAKPPPLAFTRKLEVSYTGVATPHLHIRALPPPSTGPPLPPRRLSPLPDPSGLPLTNVPPPQAAQQVVLQFSARLSASLIFTSRPVPRPPLPDPRAVLGFCVLSEVPASAGDPAWLPASDTSNDYSYTLRHFFIPLRGERVSGTARWFINPRKLVRRISVNDRTGIPPVTGVFDSLLSGRVASAASTSSFPYFEL